MSQQNQLYNTILTDLDKGKLVLPTLPDVAIKVRDVVSDPDATSAQLADIIMTDAALSARLLKVANSPLYRGRIHVDSVQTAITRLGLKMVRNLVTGLVVEQVFRPTSKKLEKRARDLWQHSIEVSAISQVIASKQSNIKTDEAMLAGLIHAIGVLPILTRAEKDPELLDDESRLDMLIENLYPRIGAAILKSWEFSPNLITVAAEHANLNRNSGPEGPDLCDVVQVANLQSYFNTDKALDPQTRHRVLAFEKLGIDTGISVVELDENSAEYAEALAMFENF
ncbi:HD-GYP domain (HD superfamily hydrolase) [Methylophaga frappieri]|uniref:HD-GYP domain (HD superfamily hydrolase) n=1 Tax=Methylophaga frappieri (strain ATCC BAA-2434 / DSM 25690 / JAM7) TaxID=754477 RepID=I1YHV0_METFJ|nr:HDOD domain-containing protein [Methylophaga frappieri]AFJ02493.1 HD-GYP domain (HD superfamily hydrolase) [Methylophaga frappieri]